MIRLMKPALALGIIGAVALAMATPSEARNGRNAAAIGAGVAGFAVGAAVGSAAAANNGRYNNGYYDNEPYRYRNGYAYAPAYNEGYAVDSYVYVPRATRYDRRDPSSFYQPRGSYDAYYHSGWNNRERALTGSDW